MYLPLYLQNVILHDMSSFSSDVQTTSRLNSRNQAMEKAPSNSPIDKHGNGKKKLNSIGAYNILIVADVHSDMDCHGISPNCNLWMLSPLFFKLFLFDVAASYSKTNLQNLPQEDHAPCRGPNQINGVQPSSFFDSWHQERVECPSWLYES